MARSLVIWVPTVSTRADKAVTIEHPLSDCQTEMSSGGYGAWQLSASARPARASLRLLLEASVYSSTVRSVTCRDSTVIASAAVIASAVLKQ